MQIMHSDRDSARDPHSGRSDGACQSANGDRNKNIRRADVKRGSKTWLQFQLMARNHGNGIPDLFSSDVSSSSQNRNGKSISLSANTEKRKAKSPYQQNSQQRHSCPALPGISSASLARLTETSGMNRAEARQEKCDGERLRKKGVTKRGVVSFAPNEMYGDKLKNHDGGTRSPQGYVIDSHSSFMRAHSSTNNSEQSTVKLNTERNHYPPRSVNGLPIPVITIDSHSDTAESPSSRRSDGNEAAMDDHDKNVDRTKSRRQYSVLLSGGTLTKRAPYLDDIETTKHGSQSLPSRYGSNGALPEEGTTKCSQKPSTSPSRKPDAPWTTRNPRQIKNYSDLLDHQNDFLLPRYKKLAGITGDHHHRHRDQHDHRQGNDGSGELGASQQPEHPLAESHRQSAAREVFEKVRLLIHGPDKAEESDKKLHSNDNRLRQAMPIYLKSGLPCGFVDTSSKCDAWLDDNDFDDK